MCHLKKKCHLNNKLKKKMEAETKVPLKESETVQPKQVKVPEVLKKKKKNLKTDWTE